MIEKLEKRKLKLKTNLLKIEFSIKEIENRIEFLSKMKEIEIIAEKPVDAKVQPKSNETLNEDEYEDEEYVPYTGPVHRF